MAPMMETQGFKWCSKQAAAAVVIPPHKTAVCSLIGYTSAIILSPPLNNKVESRGSSKLATAYATLLNLLSNATNAFLATR